jgi:folate-binding protein YgfZ
MNPLALHQLHHSLGAHFVELNGNEAVGDYGDVLAEHNALHAAAGVLDLSFRSRVCLIGADRVRFLHGQVTNDIKRLASGAGCYAALVTAKGKMQSDLNIFSLQDELLLDFEPGLTALVSQRLESFIVADDVQVVDVAPHYGLLSVQGPKSRSVGHALGLFSEIPGAPLSFVKAGDVASGEIYVMNQPRLGSEGFDLFVPAGALAAVADKLLAAAKTAGGRACGWRAFDIARIEAGTPRFGVDMDERNIPLECGIESRAVSFNKGCYIGQEIINRIHTRGHVTKELRGLRLDDDLKALPTSGDQLFHGDKEVGYVTSAVASPRLQANIALGYVRTEVNGVGTELVLRAGASESSARIITLP